MISFSKRIDFFCKRLKKKLLPTAKKSVHDKNVDICQNIWNEVHKNDVDNSISSDDDDEGEDNGEGDEGHIDDVSLGIAAITIENTLAALQDACGKPDKVDFDTFVDELTERRQASRERRNKLRDHLVALRSVR